MNKSFNKIKNHFNKISKVKFGYYCIFLLGFFIILTGIFKFPSIEIKTLNKAKNIRVEKKPEYNKENNEIKIILNGFPKVMKINGIDFQTINEKLFKSEIQEDSIINIFYKKDQIYSLEKRGVYYLHIYKANLEKRKNIKRSIILGLSLMLLTSFGVFTKKEPSLELGIVIVILYIFITIIFY